MDEHESTCEENDSETAADDGASSKQPDAPPATETPPDRARAHVQCVCVSPRSALPAVSLGTCTSAVRCFTRCPDASKRVHLQ
ncbi:hypothetical protein COCON_G00145960 [Conger conger]|uniref:Uncharacterized protein n=1 Tax=Conger conger TaxID=82655 RepID=A0A9Q1DBP8_CONCO|nr:hypothetical protein COCON_G00145960 [Conger conger]